MAKVGSYSWEGQEKIRLDLERAALSEIDEALSLDPTDEEIDDILDRLDSLDPPEDY